VRGHGQEHTRVKVARHGPELGSGSVREEGDDEWVPTASDWGRREPDVGCVGPDHRRDVAG
jgi:hypothetical protein